MAIIPEDKILYTVKEVAQLIHTNQGIDVACQSKCNLSP